MTTSFRCRAAALRRCAADPRTDASIARFMLETAADLDDAAKFDADDDAAEFDADPDQTAACEDKSIPADARTTGT